MLCVYMLMLEFMREHLPAIASRTNVMTLAFVTESSPVAMAINLISSLSLFAGRTLFVFLACYITLLLSRMSSCSRVWKAPRFECECTPGALNSARLSPAVSLSAIDYCAPLMPMLLINLSAAFAFKPHLPSLPCVQVHFISASP